MAITIVGTAQAAANINGGDVTLTFDGTPAENDVVVLVGGNADSNATGPVGPQTAGYTQQHLHLVDDVADLAGGVWTKVLGTTPDTQVVGLGTGSSQEATAYAAVVLRGVSSSTPLDVAVVEVGPGTLGADNPDPGAITTVTAGALAIVAGIMNTDQVAGAPSGYSNLASTGAVDTRRCGVMLATKEVAAAGVEDPGALFWNNDAAGHSWVWTLAIRAAAASVASLYATSTHTITNVVDEADTVIDLHLSVDDEPSSPSDADWVNNSVAVSSGASVFLGITDLPTDFGSADSAAIMIRARGQGLASATHLYAQLYQSDETTTLSNEVEVVEISSDGIFTNYSAVFTGLNTSANKAVWDGARVRFRWSNV